MFLGIPKQAWLILGILFGVVVLFAAKAVWDSAKAEKQFRDWAGQTWEQHALERP